ncbi:MAG TPA: hypothetical protein ENH62_09000 [Marinobacter sp.]|nr:hypothetical protein [Marinobacter sp.]
MKRTLIALSCLVLFAIPAYGQGGILNDSVLRADGRPAIGATVRVCTEAASGTPCSPTASIFTDKALTVSKTNPIAVDSGAAYTYYASPGFYKEQLCLGATCVTRTVLMGSDSAMVLLDRIELDRTNRDVVLTRESANRLKLGSGDAFELDEMSVGLWNDIRVVDGNKFTTCQAAEDDLGANNGLVIIPSTYAGADCSSLSSGITILDLRSGTFKLFTSQVGLAEPAFEVHPGTNNVQLHAAILLLDQIGDGQQEPSIHLRSNGTPTVGKGGFIRWEVLNDAPALKDAFTINGGLVDLTAGSEDGGADIGFLVNGAVEIIAFSGSREAFTPSTVSEGLFSLGDPDGAAGTINYIGWQGLALSHTAPKIVFYENDQTLPAGLFRIIQDAGSLRIDRNTAAAGDFSTISTDFSLSTSGRVVVGVGVSSDAGGFKHSRITTGSIGSSSSAAVTVTWGTAFADANYTVNCSVQQGDTDTATLQVDHIETVTTASVVVRVENEDAGAAKTGTLHCQAVHD